MTTRKWELVSTFFIVSLSVASQGAAEPALLSTQELDSISAGGPHFALATASGGGFGCCKFTFQGLTSAEAADQGAKATTSSTSKIGPLAGPATNQAHSSGKSWTFGKGPTTAFVSGDTFVASNNAALSGISVGVIID